MLKADENPV